MTFFYKLLQNKSPKYLFNILEQNLRIHNTRSANTLKVPFCRTDYYKNSFFPYTINEWNKLNPSIKQSKSYSVFRNSLLQIIRPTQTSIFDICDFEGVKLLTRLRLGLSHLKEHMFQHNFKETILPLCPCGQENENVSHYLLRCQIFTPYRISLLNNLRNINLPITTLDSESLTNLLLYGDKKYSYQTNKIILTFTIEFIKESKRFDNALIWFHLIFLRTLNLSIWTSSFSFSYSYFSLFIYIFIVIVLIYFHFTWLMYL